MLISKFAMGLTLLLGAFLSSRSRADDDSYEKETSIKKHRNPSVEVSENPLYKAECGSCHMVYPPGLLPARSWQALIKGLDNHFGETASLDSKTAASILEFLESHAADRSSAKKSRKIAGSIPTKDIPLRVSETSYFKKEHDEIRADVWKRKSIVSPANCIACHPQAEFGSFSEKEIRIPKS